MKKFLSFVVVTLMILSLFTGCGTNEDPAGEETQTVGLAISTLNNPFFVDLEAGAKAKAQELGVSLVTLDSQDDSATEMSNVEDLINQGVDIIMINPTDSDAVKSAVEAANNANIPVITLDRGANGGEVVFSLSSANGAGGQMGGGKIVEVLGGRGKVV